MARIVDWNAVPDSDVLPKGLYEVTVEAVQETENRHGHLMFKATYRVQEPELYTGRVLTDFFSVGSAEFPDGVDPSQFGTQNARRFFKATGVAQDPDIDKMWEEAIDQTLVVAVDAAPQKMQDGSAGPLRNNVTRYYALGDRTPQIEIPAVAPTSSNGKVTEAKGTKVPRRMTAVS